MLKQRSVKDKLMYLADLCNVRLFCLEVLNRLRGDWLSIICEVLDELIIRVIQLRATFGIEYECSAAWHGEHSTDLQASFPVCEICKLALEWHSYASELFNILDNFYYRNVQEEEFERRLMRLRDLVRRYEASR
jgi:hypothetical protein